MHSLGHTRNNSLPYRHEMIFTKRGHASCLFSGDKVDIECARMNAPDHDEKHEGQPSSLSWLRLSGANIFELIVRCYSALYFMRAYPVARRGGARIHHMLTKAKGPSCPLRQSDASHMSQHGQAHINARL